MAQVNGREVVTRQEAAKIAQVSVHTVRKWEYDGKVEIVRGAGGRPWIYVDSLWRTPKERVED